MTGDFSDDEDGRADEFGGEAGLPEYEYKKPTGTVAETKVNGETVRGHSTKIERKHLGGDNRALREQTLSDIQTKLGKLKGVKYGGRDSETFFENEKEIAEIYLKGLDIYGFIIDCRTLLSDKNG